MATEIERLLNRYDAGHVTRRELLGALAALVLPVPAYVAPAPAIGEAKRLNHVTVFVRDVERSRTFYQNLFGMAIRTRQAPGINLSSGDGFLGLYPVEQGEAPRVDHFCLGLEGFDAGRTQRKLSANGIEATVRLRGDTKELYFADPDSIRVQLQDVRYRGGVGPLGDRNPK